MDKLQCWEAMPCGREPGGKNTHELGVCPAATSKELDGMNHGKFGGRSCWAIAGTLCKGEKQGTFAQKKSTCLLCSFYQKVFAQEGEGFKMNPH